MKTSSRKNIFLRRGHWKPYFNLSQHSYTRSESVKLQTGNWRSNINDSVFYSVFNEYLLACTAALTIKLVYVQNMLKEEPLRYWLSLHIEQMTGLSLSRNSICCAHDVYVSWTSLALSLFQCPRNGKKQWIFLTRFYVYVSPAQRRRLNTVLICTRKTTFAACSTRERTPEPIRCT